MAEDLVRPVARCRSCGSSEFLPFLDLGEMPPANAFLKKEDLAAPEARFPLALCACRGCELIQLTHIVSPDALFRHYVYFSSVSTAMAKHFAAYADDVVNRFVPKDGLVVEVGSNDGILLRSLLGRPVRVLGVDPAENVGEQARASGVPTLTDFFSARVAGTIVKEHGHASAILANNVFAHIDDLDSVMGGVEQLLSPDGVFVIECPYVVDFIEHLEFDTVYHEHLSYFGTRPLKKLVERFGFEIFDVRHQSVHGGTIRTFIGRKGKHAVEPSVAQFDAREREAGVADPARLQQFARDVASLRDDLVRLVRELRASGKRVVGYTAPAKGIVLLNYCNLGVGELEYLADATPAKQGLNAPGIRLPIVSPEHFHADRPDYAILLAWNHAAEILEKERAWRDGGGKFIVPVPKVRIQ